MPLTEKDKKIMRNMKKEYGSKEGKSVFYASAKAGTLGPGAKARHKNAGRRGHGSRRGRRHG